jgi:hypothetical protein
MRIVPLSSPHFILGAFSQVVSNKEYTMDKLRKYGIIATCIPQEMYWAYESIRRSGIWNMLCVHPMLGRYQSGDNPEEMIKAMDDVYIRYCVKTNANISDPKYKHITRDLVLLIQECYEELHDVYKLPKELIKVKIEKEVKISIC